MKIKFILIVLVSLLMIDAIGQTTVTSVSYPTGTSFSNSPNPVGSNLGRSGVTFTITNTNWPDCTNWGLSITQNVLNLNNSNPPETACTFGALTYDAANAETDLANGKMCFVGNQAYYIANYGYDYTDVRMRVVVTASNGTTPIPLDKVGNYILMHADQNFVVKVYIEANGSFVSSYPGTGFTGAVTIYDYLNTYPSYSICTQFEPDSFFDVDASVGASSNSPLAVGSTLNLSGSTSMACCYNWEGPNSFSSTSQNPSISNLQNANYGTYTLTIDNGTVCYGQDDTDVLPYEYIWSGSSGTTWNTGSNWQYGMPGGTDNVRVPGGLSNYPVLNTNVQVDDLTIESGAQVTIPIAYDLTVGGNLANSGTINIQSMQTGDGSLIVDGTISGSGNANIQKYIVQDQWHLISPSVTNAQSGVFLDMWLRSYDESINDFGDYIVPTDIPLNSFQGYSVFSYTSEYRTLSGTITNSPVSATLQRSADGGQILSRGWNLIGNPYTSAIDLNAISGWTVTPLQVANAVYVWNQTQYSVSLASFGSGIGVGVNSPSQYLAVGQGFFVQAIVNGASIGINKNAQVHNSVQFRDDEITPNLISIEVEGNEFSDETVIHYVPQAESDYDYFYDAAKLYGIADAPQLYTKKQESMLSIQSVNDMDILDGKSIFLEVGADAEYSLLFTHTFNSLYDIVIRDLETNFIIYPDEEYIFTAQQDDGAERFKIVYSTTFNESFETSEIKIWEYDNILYVNVPQNEQLRNVSVYNILGEKVLSTTSTVVDLNELSDAMYVVSVTTDVQELSQKIIVD